jgi:hypothetical protein
LTDINIAPEHDVSAFELEGKLIKLVSSCCNVQLAALLNVMFLPVALQIKRMTRSKMKTSG